jgi:hypothetical protein
VTILRERVIWAKPRAQNETRRSSDLTPQEQANVQAAVRFMRARLGVTKLAEALKTTTKTVKRASSVRGKPSAGLAIRVARLADVPVEDVLAGRWPVPGGCRHCGRGGADR